MLQFSRAIDKAGLGLIESHVIQRQKKTRRKIMFAKEDLKSPVDTTIPSEIKASSQIPHQNVNVQAASPSQLRNIKASTAASIDACNTAYGLAFQIPQQQKNIIRKQASSARSIKPTNAAGSPFMEKISIADAMAAAARMSDAKYFQLLDNGGNLMSIQQQQQLHYPSNCVDVELMMMMDAKRQVIQTQVFYNTDNVLCGPPSAFMPPPLPGLSINIPAETPTTAKKIFPKVDHQHHQQLYQLYQQHHKTQHLARPKTKWLQIDSKVGISTGVSDQRYAPYGGRKTNNIQRKIMPVAPAVPIAPQQH